MSDEPTERDAEALADVLADHRPSVGYNDAHADLIACSCDGTIYEAPDYRAHVAAVLAERIAQARREGAAEALYEAAKELPGFDGIRTHGDAAAWLRARARGDA